MGISSSAHPANRSTPTVPQTCWFSIPNGASASGWKIQDTKDGRGCSERNTDVLPPAGSLKPILSCKMYDQLVPETICYAPSFDNNPPKTPALGRCYYRQNNSAFNTVSTDFWTKEACEFANRKCVRDGVTNAYCANWCALDDPNCKDTVTPPVAQKGRCYSSDVTLIQRDELTRTQCDELTYTGGCVPSNNGPNGLSYGCTKWCSYADPSCTVPVFVPRQQPPPVIELARLPTSSDIQELINACLGYQNAARSGNGLTALKLTDQQNLLACTAETARIDAQYNMPYIEPKDESKQVGHYRFDVLTGKLNYPCIPSTSDGSQNSGYMQYNNVLDGFARVSTFTQVAKLIVAGFQNSQRHRDNMLSKVWNTCSIGAYCWKQPSGNYFCWLVCDYFTAGSGPQPARVDCAGDWQLGTCNRSCGGGQQTDTFRVSRPASNGGSQCSYNDGQTRSNPCNTQACPVNCVGDWQNGTCSRTCGGGTQTDVFRISQQASGGGSGCGFNDGQARKSSCNTQPCPVDCQGGWSRGACDCRGGQPESYYITQQAANGGAPCEAVQGFTRTVQTGCICNQNVYYANQGTYDWSTLKQNANDADLQWAKTQYPTRCVELASSKPTKLCPAPSTGGGSTANLYYTGNGNNNWTLFTSNVSQSALTQYQTQYPNYCWIWSNTQPTSRCTLGSAPAPSATTNNIYSSNPGENVWYLREYQVPQSRLQYWQSNYAGQCWVWTSTQPTSTCALAGGNSGFGTIYWANKGQSQWTLYMDSALQSDLSKYKTQYPGYCWQWVSNTVQPNKPTNVANC